MNIKLPIFLLDMDGVLVNFEAGIPYPPDRIDENGGKWWENPVEMHEKGFFRNLPPLACAKDAVYRLLNEYHLDVHICSKPVANEHCASEKFGWVMEHFPELVKKIHLVQDKSLMRGHYLVDDDARWLGLFEGRMFHFNTSKPEESWAEIFAYLDKYKKGV